MEKYFGRTGSISENDEKHIMARLPFMATEYIIMEGVKNGGDKTGASRKNKSSLNGSRKNGKSLRKRK